MNVWNAFLICCILCTVKLGNAKKGFILTSSKVLDAGTTEYFTLSVFDVPPGEEITIHLLRINDNSVLAESKVNVLPNHNMWVEMFIPPLKDVKRAKLHIFGTFSGLSSTYKIDEKQEVSIRSRSDLTLIQTDKPLYKPGQTVRFRVLPMDSELKPLGKDATGDIWVEDSNGIRVSQWKNLTFERVMMQLKLPLSEEPTLGTWSIKSLINNVISVQNFKIEKYVLPKFEVKINSPWYIMDNAEMFSTEFCAWYTYGKKVDGFLRAKFIAKERWRNSFSSVEHIGEISGCHTVVINTLSFGNFNSLRFKTIEIFAEVVENGTEIRVNKTTEITLVTKSLRLKFLNSVNGEAYIKPRIPYSGAVLLTHLNGTAATSVKVRICADFTECLTFISDKNGLINFILNPRKSIMSSIELEAEVVDPLYVADRFYRRVTSKLTLIPWDSPSDSYLQIEPITEEVTCEKSQRVTIRYTAKKGDTIQFYHQVLSRGRIVQQGSHQRTFYFNEDAFEDDSTKIFSDTVVGNSVSLSNVGEFVLSFIPKASMSPIARLLVFYVRENGEIIADSKMFRIQKCLMNKVRLNFRHKQQYPSTEATMLLSASPFSICGIGLVDKSIQLLSKDTKFNKEKLFQWMESHDVSSDTEPRRSRKHRCNPYPLPQQRRGSFSAWRMDYELDGFPEFYFNEDHADSVNAFENAGIVVLTDLKLETRKCTLRDPFPHGISRHPYITAKSRSFDQLPHEAYFVPQRLSIPTTKVPDELDIQEIPESTPKSTEEIRSYFPETWLWEIQKIDSSGETAMKRQLPHTITEWIGEAVCINSKNGLGFSEKSSITAFQPFFVSLQLPYSVIRDETVPIIVSVFNYLTECLPIKISLEPSEDFYLTSESSSHKMCVCGGKSETHHFKLRPISLGQVNITVYGFSVEGDDEICGNEVTARLSARDAITKQLLVEAEGFPKEEVINYFICPEATNGSYSSEVDLLLPENVVDGSARAYVSVSSDLMAQALNGLKSLVKLPVGCGEQNMVLFAPNIFVLDYLSATGKITEDLKEDCLNNMRKGYQRELQYRRNDGSYSAFGKSDRQGSLWLTAFVLKSFGQARRFMDIDENDLLISSQWILNRQFENGCFEPSGRILHKDMKGGLNEGEQSLAPLTAYILISLLESGAESLNHTAAKNALKCLAADGIPNNYALALYAYATALSREIDTAKQHLKLLDERAVIKDGNKFWETSHKSKSVSVEIAGYYVLALLEVNEQNSIPTSLPVVKWIAQQRNSNGGFVSTQDTIVALQALAKYSALTSQISVDIGLVVQSDELVRGFKLDENNRLVSQRAKLPVLPTVAEMQAVGDGCALVQFSLRYNVKTVPGSEAFDLDVKVVRQGSSSCNTPRIEICMRYKATDETSNMVVVAVKMASGFVPSEWSLDVLQSDQTIRLKRYEVQGNLVNLYFNELTNKLKCFSFNIKNEIDVQDVKPATVKLYDYYQPELEVTKEYVIPPDCVAPNLPELPELLTSSLAEELFPTFDDELLSTLGSTFLPDEPDTGITNVFSNSTVIPHIIQIVDKSAHAEELSDDAKHQSAHAEELSDDASSFQTIENANHLANFVDLTDDPDFPDGIEGNLPISILPPIQSISELNDETAVLDCPVCMNKFPANFTDIYCTSAFALRANVRSGNAKVVKILQDVSYYLQQPQPVKKFAEVKWDERCSCRQLTGGENTIIITGTPITLWSSEKKKHQIHLTAQAHVISSAGKTVQPKELKEARKSCEGDP